MQPRNFYLGTRLVDWLWSVDKVPVGVPLFVSYSGIRRRATMQPVQRRWALDSAAFSEIARHGRWTKTEHHYVSDVRWLYTQVGGLEWAAPQDWMCEPPMLKRTGLTVPEHQRRTVLNYLRLRDLDASLPFIPALQGWERDDYMRHIEMYDAAHVPLDDLPLVGVGSVCKRQATDEIADIFSAIHAQGIHRVHGFGVKTEGVGTYGHYLHSADSLAWSFAARRRQLLLPGCTGHRSCQNCPRWARMWRKQVLARINA